MEHLSKPNSVLLYLRSVDYVIFSPDQHYRVGAWGSELPTIPALWFGGVGARVGGWGLKVSLANWSAPWCIFPEEYTPIGDAKV